MIETSVMKKIKFKFNLFFPVYLFDRPENIRKPLNDVFRGNI